METRQEHGPRPAAEDGMRDQDCRTTQAAQEERWAAEYLAMATGVVTHAEHQVRIAQFTLQHSDRYSAKAVAWARAVLARQGETHMDGLNAVD